MPDKVEYVGVAGFVQFDVNEREANDQTVRDVVVKSVGAPKNVRVTLWPEFGHVPVEKGDFVAAEGKFTRSSYQGQDGSEKESLQISAKLLNVNGQRQEPKETRSVAKADSQDADEDLF